MRRNLSSFFEFIFSAIDGLLLFMDQFFKLQNFVLFAGIQLFTLQFVLTIAVSCMEQISCENRLNRKTRIVKLFGIKSSSTKLQSLKSIG